MSGELELNYWEEEGGGRWNFLKSGFGSQVFESEEAAIVTCPRFCVHQPKLVQLVLHT